VATLPRRMPGLLIIVLACAAGLALLRISTLGIGLSSDSAVYVAAARNLVDGKGLSWISGGGEIRPLTLHAPLLPILLAGAEAMGADAIPAARGLNALCLALDVLLVGAVSFKLTGSGWLAGLAALVMAGTGEMYRVHAWLMSEPLFVTLTLAGVLTLLQRRQHPRGVWLVLASVAFGLAALTRYGGLALPVAGVAFLLLDPDAPWRRRLRESALMLALGLGPTAIWMVRNYALTGQTGGRSFGAHLDIWPSLRDQALAIVLNWYAPLRLVEWIIARPGAIAVLVAVAGFGLALVAALLLTPRIRQALVGRSWLSGVLLLGACLLSYVAVTFFAALFSTPGADINERVLAPVYPLLWLVLVAALSWVWSHGRLAGKVAVALLLVLLVRNKLVYAYWTLRELGSDGLGYSSRAWLASETIEKAVALDPGVIYTNDTAAIYLLAGRPSYVVPWGLPDYDPEASAQLEAEMMAVMTEKQGALVLFGSGDLPAGWSGSHLRVWAQADDGVILLPVGPETP
jgi:Dolichyl-phosphate-mannose-protein mannosyltransferase